MVVINHRTEITFVEIRTTRRRVVFYVIGNFFEISYDIKMGCARISKVDAAKSVRHLFGAGTKCT